MKQSEITKKIEEFIKEKFNTVAGIDIEPHLIYGMDSPDIVIDYNIDIKFNIRCEK